MTTKTSSHKCGSGLATYLDTIRRNRSVFIFGIVLMMAAPLGAVIDLTTERSNALLSFLMLLSIAVPIVMSVLIPIIVFSYLHSKKAIDTYHSLPIKRSDLFFGKFFAGLTIALAPAVLGYGLTLMLDAASLTDGLSSYSYVQELGSLALRILPSVITIYVFMVFVLVACGTLWEALLYGVAMTFSLAGICYSIPSLVEQLYGFDGSSGLSEWLISFTPFYFLFADTVDYRAVFSVVMTIGLVLISLFLYQCRKSENTGLSFSFRFMFHIVSVFISVCLIFILYALNNELISALLLGFLAYFIMSVIADRGFKRLLFVILRTAGIIAFCAGFIVAFEGTGGFGYEMRLPNPESITSVYLRPIDVGNYGSYNDYSPLGSAAGINAKALGKRIFSGEEVALKGYTSAENIKTVYRLHQSILRDREQPTDYAQVVINIEYRLKNGGILRRRYYNVSRENFERLIELNRTEEYLQLKYPFLKDGYHYDTTAKVYHLNPLSTEQSIDLFEAWSITAEEVAQALKKDILSRPFGFELAPDAEYVGQILLSTTGISEHRLDTRLREASGATAVKIYECDRNILALLENRGFLTALRRTKAEYSDVLYFYPAAEKEEIFEYNYRVSGIDGYQYEKAEPKYYRITDEEDRAFLLKRFQPSYYSEVDCDTVTLWADSNYIAFLVPNIEQAKLEEILSRAEIVGYVEY